MPLKTLKIRNFQTHRALKVVFDPGLTVLVGDTASGKSAVLRALRWLCTNKPGGNAFITKGEEQSQVILKFDDRTITRTRGKTNAYMLDGKRLVAFGAEPPEPVKQALNLSAVNFQGQHDPAFWLSDGPGEVSRKLNAVIDLGIIDTTLAKLGAAMREAKSWARITTENRDEARKEFRRVADAPALEARLRKIERLFEATSEKALERDGLARVVRQADSAEKASQIARQTASAGALAIRRGAVFAALTEKHRTLTELVTQVTELSKVAARPKPPSPDRAAAAVVGLQLLEADRFILGQVVAEGDRLVKTAKDKHRECEWVKGELEDKIGKVCPLCQSPQ